MKGERKTRRKETISNHWNNNQFENQPIYTTNPSTELKHPKTQRLAYKKERHFLNKERFS